jgi:membrane protein YdbS with pleckstrin-like domain
MRTLCSSTLIGEFFVIGFAGLVAMKQPDLSQVTVWTVCGIAMLLCVLLCGAVTRPGALVVGWVLQAALIASGFVLGTMFVLGIIFAALWWASIHYGRKIDEIRARPAAPVA